MYKDYWYQKEAVDAMLRTEGNDVVVLPTGSGKSHVIKDYCTATSSRVLILSHVKEILEQNFDRFAGIEDIGLYSAGFDVRVINRITVAGIHSVYKRPALFRDNFDRVLIDEAHLVNNEGMYKTFLDETELPYLGLTATDFRMKGGYIHGKDRMFDDVCYRADTKRLTEEGYLCPLVYYSDKEPLDTTGIKVTGGDFNLKQMSLAFNRNAVSKGIVEQIARYPHNHILIFCIDIDHAENVAKLLNEAGVPSAAVHSKSPRDEALLKFKNGQIRALTNVNVLTTGFDAPFIDMIVILRPTKSMGLHQQMLGRGMRTHPSKQETLIKDFTRNTLNLGTVIDAAPIETEKKRRKGGDNPFMKECPECMMICHPNVRNCPKCNYKFKFRHNLSLVASQPTGRDALPQWYEVTDTKYYVHHKPGMPNSVKAVYICGTKTFNQYITLEHEGYAGHKARRWLDKRFKGRPQPTSAQELVRRHQELKPPRRIQVDEKGKYPSILSIV